MSELKIEVKTDRETLVFVVGEIHPLAVIQGIKFLLNGQPFAGIPFSMEEAERMNSYSGMSDRELLTHVARNSDQTIGYLTGLLG